MRGAETYLLGVIRGERKGFLPSMLRTLLTLLSYVYVAGLKLFLLPYALGIRKQTKLPCPVISVGNLKTGGTGKTPTTQTLCRVLTAQGKRVVILNRGYGGQNEYGCAVVSDGETVLLTAEQAGDEAFLLASTLPGVPVVVGKDRRVTGKLAYEKFRPDVIVLDDGMQFWQLHKDVLIVLLNASKPFDNGYPFPRGLLREPITHLRRAGIILLTGTQQANAATLTATREQAAKLAPNTPIYEGNLAPTGLVSLTDDKAYSLDWLVDREVSALSAIGNPSSFSTLLGQIGADVTGIYLFPDHAVVSREAWQTSCEHEKERSTEAILTTEKDAVKFPQDVKSAIPVLSLTVQMQIDNKAVFFSKVQSLLDGG